MQPYPCNKEEVCRKIYVMVTMLRHLTRIIFELLEQKNLSRIGSQKGHVVNLWVNMVNTRSSVFDLYKCFDVLIWPQSRVMSQRLRKIGK